MQDELWALERACFVLRVHEGNPEIVEQWEAWRTLLPEPDMALLLPALEVVRAGEAEGLAARAAWVRKRYRLEDATTPEPE